jgi:polyphosphate kinase 2 (PPK2 family)
MRVKKADADAELHGFVEELETAQALLYATSSHAVLMVLQGLDAAGKDGTVKHVLSGVNPPGVQVTSFKQPSSLERGHELGLALPKVSPERRKQIEAARTRLLAE